MTLEKPINIIPDQEFEPKNRVVNALVLNNEGQYLLLKRLSNHTFYPNYWGIVMEKVKDGEVWEETLFRGIGEELGISLDQESILFQGEDIYREWKGKSYQIKTYYVDIEDREIELNEEHEEYVWVDPEYEKLDELDIMPDALEMISNLKKMF